MTRWRIYLRERFPLAGHAPLVAAFSLSAVSVSRLLRGERGLPGPAALAVAFVVALLFFFQLRVVTSSRMPKMTADTGRTGPSRGAW